MMISTSNMVRTVCTMWLEQSVQLKRSLYSAVEGCEGHNIDKRGIRVDTACQKFGGYGCWLPARVGVLRKEVQSAVVWNFELSVTRWKDGHTTTQQGREK